MTPESAPTFRRRRTRRWPLVLLAVLLVAALGGGVYLATLARAWSERAEALESTASELGRELALTRSDLDQRDHEVQAAREQLQTARDRIVELADEKAQVGDDRETQRQLLDYQERVAAAAAGVATALQECVTGQAQIITYLKDAERYDAKDLRRAEREVDSFCDQAVEANDELQRELDR